MNLEQKELVNSTKQQLRTMVDSFNGYNADNIVNAVKTCMELYISKRKFMQNLVKNGE